MAWARRLPSGHYQGLYRDRAGRVRTEGAFVHKRDAVSAATEQESRLRRGEWIDPELGRVTFEAWAKRWLVGSTPMLKPKTVASYESLLRSRVLPTFGRQPLHDVQPSDVTTWIGAMIRDGLSPSRIRQAHVVLRLVLEAAMRDGYVARNVALGAKLPRLQHREAPYFEPSVVDAITEAIGAPYSALVAIMGVCGLRWGEAVALRRRHVDALRRRLIVEESLAEISGRLVFGPTKSHAHRSVPLSPGVMARLGESLSKAGTDGLVFTAPEGGPLRHQNFLSRRWRPTLQRLGLPITGVHVLAAQCGGAHDRRRSKSKDVAEGSRHRSAAFSLTVYGHLFDADLDALAERLDERKAL